MIHLRQVAQLMNNDVIHQVRRQQRNLIIEIQIPSPRTTPPSRFLIPDRNAFPRESIDEIEMRNSRSDQFQRPIFILGNFLLRPLRRYRFCILLRDFKFLQNPFPLFHNHFLNRPPPNKHRRRHHQSPIRMYRKPQHPREALPTESVRDGCFVRQNLQCESFAFR